MTTATLWEIGDDLLALDDLLAEIGGDVSEEEAERAIDEWLAETREAEAAKLDRYAALIRTLEARAEIQEAESKRLADRARANKNNARRLKDRLLLHMERTGQKKIAGNLYAATVAKNGGKAPVEVTVDPRDLPAPFRRAKLTLACPTDETLEALADQATRLDLEPDTDAIRTALEAGEKLPFARLGDRGHHVRIR